MIFTMPASRTVQHELDSLFRFYFRFKKLELRDGTFSTLDNTREL